MSDLTVRLRQNAPFLTALVLFVLVYLGYHLAHPKGFSSAVLIQNADEAFALSMLAMAQTIPVLAAGLDLSVGANMTMVACFASYLLTGTPEGVPLSFDFAGLHVPLGALPGGGTGLIVGVVLCLAIGTAAGLVNGIIVVFGRIQPIIATLATAAIYMGVALFLRPQPGGKINEDLNWALTNGLGDFASTVHWFDDGNASWFAPFSGIPTSIVLLVIIVVVVWIPFSRTVTGRTVMAVGSAEGAAFMSGLPVARSKAAAFALGGFFAACGGLFLAIQTSSGNADIPQAEGYTLNSIAAVVIGGTSLLGGVGGALGSVIGAFFLRVITFFFRIFDVAPLLQPLFEGLILLAAVCVGALRALRVKNTLELFR